eukprot:357832-Chlamydomonas_euryale.AAC.7
MSQNLQRNRHMPNMVLPEHLVDVIGMLRSLAAEGCRQFHQQTCCFEHHVQRWRHIAKVFFRHESDVRVLQQLHDKRGRCSGVLLTPAAWEHMHDTHASCS